VVTVAVTVTLGVAATAPASLADVVKAAIKAHLSGLKLGDNANVTAIAHAIYNASPEVENVTGLQVDGGTLDVAVTRKQVVEPGLITVSVA
jgi:hypothetical protein